MEALQQQPVWSHVTVRQQITPPPQTLDHVMTPAEHKGHTHTDWRPTWWQQMEAWLENQQVTLEVLFHSLLFTGCYWTTDVL